MKSFSQSAIMRIVGIRNVGGTDRYDDRFRDADGAFSSGSSAFRTCVYGRCRFVPPAGSPKNHADHSGVVRDPNRSESLGKRSVCQPHGSASEGLSLRFRFCRTPSDPDPVFANRTTGRQKMAAVGVCRGQRGAVFQFALNEMVFPDTGIRFRFSARTAVDQQLHTQRGPVGFIAVAFAFSLS